MNNKWIDWQEIAFVTMVLWLCLTAGCHSEGWRGEVGVYRGGIDNAKGDRLMDSDGVYFGVSFPLSRPEPTTSVLLIQRELAVPPAPAPSPADAGVPVVAPVEGAPCAPVGAAPDATGEGVGGAATGASPAPPLKEQSGVEEHGCPRCAHNAENAGSNPAPATTPPEKPSAIKVLGWSTFSLALLLAAWKWKKPIKGFLSWCLEIVP